MATETGFRGWPVRDGLRSLVVGSRPRFWLYLAGPVLVGVAYGAETQAELLSLATLVLFAYFLVPANVFLYGINDVFDREADAENPKKTTGPEARWGGGRLLPAAVVGSALAILPVAAVVPPAAWPWLAAFLVLGAAYSAPPVRFKTTPLFDSVSNGLYVTPGVAAYVAVAGSHPPVVAVAAGWAWAMGMHTFSAIPDIGPDRAAGIETTATALGETRAYGYCGACWLAAAAGFFWLDVRLGVLLSVYPVLVTTIVLSEVDVGRAYWWFPAINTVVGAVLTAGGLWVVVYG